MQAVRKAEALRRAEPLPGVVESAPLASSASRVSIWRQSCPCSRSMTKMGPMRPAAFSGGNKNSSSK